MVSGSMMLAFFMSVLILIHVEATDPAGIILGLAIPTVGTGPLIAGFLLRLDFRRG
jgi:hypothetical protein